MTRLKFIILIMSFLGCTSTGPITPTYPTDERKSRKNERKRRKRTGYKRKFKNPK